MAFFCKESERTGTCYVEFQKGDWNEQSYWKADSLLIEDMNYEDYVFKAVSSVLPEHNPYGITQVSKLQWQQILEKADFIGGEIRKAIEEANIWVKQTFQTHESFTILGL